MQTYERIEAKGPAEAIAKSRWHVGQVAKCTRLTAYPDHGRPRSYRVLPTFEPLVPEQTEDPTGLLDERPGASYGLPPTDENAAYNTSYGRAKKENDSA